MHPARQKRLGASLVALVAAWFLTLAASPQLPTAPQRPGAPARVDKKKEAKKKPPLSMHEAWSATLPSAPTAPAGYDAARAYIPIQEGQLVALSLQDGAIAWTVKAGASGSPVTGDGLVIVPATNAIVALDAATGAPRWRVALDSPLSAPLVSESGWLLAATETRGALMLRAASGERLWQRLLPAKACGPAAMTGDRLYLPLDNARLAALKLSSGETIWESPTGGRPTAVVPLDDRIFVGADNKYFYCLSAKNGKVDWRWRTGGAIVGRPAIDEDNVYFLSLDNVLRALDRGNGTQAWHTGLPFRPSAGPFLNGRLLVVAGLAEIRAYQFIDGSDAGTADVADVLSGPPHFLASKNDSVSPVIVVTRDGMVRLLAASAPALEAKPFPPKPVYPLWPWEGQG